MAVLAALALGAVRQTPGPAADLLPRVGSWPGFMRGPALDVAVAGNYVYVAIGKGGLIILDMTETTNPVRVGEYLTPGYTDQVRVVGSRAYLADGGGGNLVILDVSDPTRPRLLGSHKTGTWIESLQVDGERVYLGNGGLCHCQAAFFILDVSNPARPVTLSVDWERGAGRIAVAGKRAYVFSRLKNLRVLDVSQPASPTVLAELETAEQVEGMQTVGDRLYVVRGWERGELLIYDTGDASAFRLLSTLELPGASSDIEVVGDYAYVTTSDAGLVVVGVSEPTAPVIAGAGTRDTPGWAERLDVSNGVAYVANGSGGLRVLDVRDPAQIIAVANFDTGPTAGSVRLAGDKAHLLPRKCFANPWKSTKRLLCEVVARRAGRFMGSYACVTGDGLQVFDLGDPHNPVRVGSHGASGTGAEFGSETRGLQVVGNLVYVAAGDYGLAIYRLTPQLRLNPPVVDGNALRLSWLGGPGIRLQKATSLSAPDWQDVPDSEGASSLELTLTHREVFFRLGKR